MKKLHCARADDKFKPIPGTEFELKADLVLLAMGFVHPVHEGMIKTLGLELDPRGNVKADTDRLPDLERRRCSPRRHAPRPVAGGLGDPRRPPGRARGRQVPDGRDDAAALTPRRIRSKSSGRAEKQRRLRMPSLLARRLLRTRRVAAAALAAAALRARLRLPSAAAPRARCGVAAPARRGVAGAGCMTGIGSRGRWPTDRVGCRSARRRGAARRNRRRGRPAP